MTEKKLDQCTWVEEGEWRIGIVEGNFRKITTRHGERFVVNVNVAGEKESVWLESKVKGGTKQAGFLEAVGCVYKDGDKFNPMSLMLVGIEVLCLWGLIKAKGKVLRDGVVRYKKFEYP